MACSLLVTLQPPLRLLPCNLAPLSLDLILYPTPPFPCEDPFSWVVFSILVLLAPQPFMNAPGCLVPSWVLFSSPNCNHDRGIATLYLATHPTQMSDFGLVIQSEILAALFDEHQNQMESLLHQPSDGGFTRYLVDTTEYVVYSAYIV